VFCWNSFVDDVHLTKVIKRENENLDLELKHFSA